MRQTYQLAPIPPFRGYGAKIQIPTSASTSTCSSTLSLMTQSESSSSLAISVDEDVIMAPPSRPANISPQVFQADEQTSTTSSPPLTSFHVGKRRSVALAKLKLPPLPTYSLDPDGTSALPPPSPLVHQQILNDQYGPKPPSSPELPPFSNDINPGKASLIPLRFQPKRFTAPKLSNVLSTIKGTPADENNPAQARVSPTSLSSRAAQAQSYFAGLQKSKILRNAGAPNHSFPDNRLTPPPTPNTRQEKNGPKMVVTDDTSAPDGSRTKDLRVPLTPLTSPTNKVHAALNPPTVSAKALSLHRLHPLFDKRYLLGDELGSGGFGFVVQATRQSDGLLCAVKFIYKDKVPHHAWVKDELWGDDDDVNGVMRTKDGIKRVPLEAYVLKTIRHRGVVSYVDLYEDKSYLYLVMEHHGTPWTAPEKEPKSNTSPYPMPSSAELPNTTPAKKQPMQPYVNGTLLTASPTKIVNPPIKPALSVPNPPSAMMRRASCDLFECIEQHSRLPERYAKYVFAQLVDVVGCLHYNGFVHRDIKDENIVIDDKYRVKLIDFGSTYLFDYRNEVQTLSRFFGTLNFAAPEILKKGAYQPMAAEVWSLGILLTILVTGESFFRDTESIKAYKASPPNQKISESCMDLIFRCLALDPDDRWSCFRMRTHPWLADCQWPWSDLPHDASIDSIRRVRK